MTRDFEHQIFHRSQPGKRAPRHKPIAAFVGLLVALIASTSVWLAIRNRGNATSSPTNARHESADRGTDPAVSGSRAVSDSVSASDQQPATVSGPSRDVLLASHQRMIETLAQLSERAKTENSYLGDARATKLQAVLSQLPGSEKVKRFQAHLALGTEFLELGREIDAMKQYASAEKLLTSLQDDLTRDSLGAAAVQLNFFSAVACLRWGETQNCCKRNTPESCIVPIRGEGIHTDPSGSNKAIEYLTRVLQSRWAQKKQRLGAVWLLNLAYMTTGGYPDKVPAAYLIPPETFQSQESIPRFHNIAERLGLSTFSLAGGAIADDFDGDGYLDLFVSTMQPSGEMRLFHNNQDGTFTARDAGLDGITGGLNLVQADYDNDGDVDILVLRGAWWGEQGRHPNSLLQNDGHGTFLDVTFASGLGDVHYPTQTASWADCDNDGDVDLYIGNENGYGGESVCQFFRNHGDGTFSDETTAVRLDNDGYTKAVIWGDYDADGWPDLFVSNYERDNRLFRNNQDGTFTDVAREVGVAEPRKSFPAWFWDFDNDGVLDLYVSSYCTRIEDLGAAALGLEFEKESQRLYRGDGQGKFIDATDSVGIKRPTAPMGSNFGDLDNDGFLDMYLGTGYPDYFALMPNIMYRNQQGKSLVDVTTAGGFGHVQKGHAIVFADLNNDGDQEIFEQMGGAYLGDGFFDALYQNPGFGNHWIAVRLVGVQTNRSAIGARIRVDVNTAGDAQRTIYRHVNSGGTFGANPLRQTIGLGAATKIERIEIYWPTSGKVQEFRDVPLDRAIRIVEGQDQYEVIPLKRFRL